VLKFQVVTVAKTPADAALASWIANSNFLVVLALGPIFGSLSDRVGKKWFLVGGALVGVAGSCIAGSAKSIQAIIGGQIMNGAANAGCVSTFSPDPLE
jgi:MFS family permease